jgi:predicted nucleic acid-binding protein
VTRPLDINLLIALLWSHHEHHRVARRWFQDVRRFATCPLTQLGFVQVSSNPAIGYALEVTVAREVLRDLTKHEIAAESARVAKELGKPRSTLFLEAIQAYLRLYRFRKLQEKVKPRKGSRRIKERGAGGPARA